MKFSFWYDILFWYHVNWKRTPFQDENANRVVWGEWRMLIDFKMVDKTIVFKMAESVDFVMWMQYELHSGTKLIPEWNSFWYHVNSPLESHYPGTAEHFCRWGSADISVVCHRRAKDQLFFEIECPRPWTLALLTSFVMTLNPPKLFSGPSYCVIIETVKGLFPKNIRQYVSEIN